MRKYALIPIIIISGIISFFIGFYLFKIENVEKEEEQKILLAAQTTKNEVNLNEYLAIKTSALEDKINPNTKIIEKIYYEDCGHIKENVKKPDEKFINMNKKQFQAEYMNWEIQKFTNNEVVVYKEVYDFCDEHFNIGNLDGKVVVYKLNKNGKEVEREITEIETRYLTDQDIAKLQNGIEVSSIKELNKVLEDFE